MVRKPRIFINPGHAQNGDPDPGAVSAKGTRESDIAFKVGKLVKYYLEKADCNCMLFQDDNLKTICEKSIIFDTDLFVSIHCNSADNRIAQGTECFCFARWTKAERLAQCIQWQIVHSLDTVDRGVKTADYYVLLHTEAPATLVELEFISNQEGEETLLTRQDDFARAIARGVTDYLRL